MDEILLNVNDGNLSMGLLFARTRKSSGIFSLIWKAERRLGLILKILKTTLDFLQSAFSLKIRQNNTGSGTHKDKKTGFYWQ